MRIVEDVRDFNEALPDVVMTVGSFDGVHLGHQAILNRVAELARQSSGTAALLTMDPHPREYFSPDRAPNLLTSRDKKAELLAAAGLDVLFVLPFNEKIANLEPEEFIRDILIERCRAKMLVVGHDFAFGRQARGDFDYLRAAATRYGFGVEQASPVRIEGERVSSTLVREFVLQGDLDRAEQLLGRKYSVSGVVVKGRGIGRKLGYPTANIKPFHSATPAHGVYVAEAVLDGLSWMAAVNIGIAPTIRHEDVTIEAYVLDFDGDLAGRKLELIFHKRLRPEKKFPNYDALVAQIGVDVYAVRAYFEQDGTPQGNL